MTSCPKCGRFKAESTRGCLFWVCVVMIFPIGLLLCLIPEEYRCSRCGWFGRL